MNYNNPFLFYHSKLLFSSGDLESSLSSAMDAYDINSDDISLLKHRGNLYRLLNMSESAIQDFNKALTLGYDNRDLYLYRGLSYIQTKNEDLALNDLNKFLIISHAF